jgi:PAS domain S-box-containing protein
MLIALDGTAILVSGISTLGLIVVGVIGYLGIKAQLTKSNDMNTSQHGEVYGIVKHMVATLKDLDATIGLLISTQGFPVFKNTQDGRLIWANSAALELLGLPFDELSKDEIWPTVIHEEDRERVTSNWFRQIETQKQQPPITYRYVHPITKNQIEVRGMSRPVFDQDGSVREWVSVVVPLHHLTYHEKIGKEVDHGLA